MFWYLHYFRFLKAPPKDRNPFSLPDTVMGSSMPSIKMYFVFRFIFCAIENDLRVHPWFGTFFALQMANRHSKLNYNADHRWTSAQKEIGATRLFVSWNIEKIEQSIFIIRQYRFYWNWSHFRAFSDIGLNLSQSNSNRLIVHGIYCCLYVGWPWISSWSSIDKLKCWWIIRIIHRIS